VQQVGVGLGRQYSADSSRGKGEGAARAAWEAATAKARTNRAPSHQPMHSAQTKQQSKTSLVKRSAVTASQGFGAGSIQTKPGVSALTDILNTPSQAAKTGMPLGMSRGPKIQ